MRVIAEVLQQYSGRFAVELGIDLRSGPAARQRWFLAAILYGARISGQLAGRTYRVFAARGFIPPRPSWPRGGTTWWSCWTKAATPIRLQDRHQAPPGDGRSSRTVPWLPGAASRPLPELYGPGKPPAGAGCGDRAHHGQYFPQGTPGHLGPGHAPPEPPGPTGRRAPGAVSSGPHAAGGPGGPDLAWQAQPEPGCDLADLEAALVRLGLALRRRRRPGGD